jgi:anhydro-N-acetylmuramic acid kinase
MNAFVIGIMTGTSLDGVDAVLVDFSTRPFRVHATVWQPYPKEVRQQASQLQHTGADELHRAALLGNALAHCYARAVQQLLAEANVAPAQIAAIGCHGQTVRHRPEAGYSIQINHPALLAELTGIAVVADFRSRDIAAGGQGAPLVPAFHAEVFGAAERHRVILNIGGIANVTNLAPGQPVRGFDCGPGNVLLDAWYEAHHDRPYDESGNWARQGKLLPALLARLLAHEFFKKAPPKSSGRDEFNWRWLGQQLAGNEHPGDVQATLAEFTAIGIAESIRQWCGQPAEMFVCGGGVHNGHLMARLGYHLPTCRIASTDFLNLPPDWVEATAFAWLAWRTLNGQPGNLPSVTGASGTRVLGAIYPA